MTKGLHAAKEAAAWLTLSNSLTVFGQPPNFYTFAFNTENIAACRRDTERLSIIYCLQLHSAVETEGWTVDF